MFIYSVFLLLQLFPLFLLLLLLSLSLFLSLFLALFHTHTYTHFVSEHYPEHMETLVQQCMEWCDSYCFPILVPLSSWLPDPRETLVTTFECPEGVTALCSTLNTQHLFTATPKNEIKMFHIASKKLIRTLTGNEEISLLDWWGFLSKSEFNVTN